MQRAGKVSSACRMCNLFPKKLKRFLYSKTSEEEKDLDLTPFLFSLTATQVIVQLEKNRMVQIFSAPLT